MQFYVCEWANVCKGLVKRVVYSGWNESYVGFTVCGVESKNQELEKLRAIQADSQGGVRLPDVRMYFRALSVEPPGRCLHNKKGTRWVWRRYRRNPLSVISLFSTQNEVSAPVKIAPQNRLPSLKCNVQEEFAGSTQSMIYGLAGRRNKSSNLILRESDFFCWIPTPEKSR